MQEGFNLHRRRLVVWQRQRSLQAQWVLLVFSFQKGVPR
jgi:hypothetical protein